MYLKISFGLYFLVVAALSGPHQFHAFTVKICLMALYICMSSISAPRVDLQLLKDLVAFNAMIKPILHKQINAPFVVSELESLVGLFLFSSLCHEEG